MDNNIQNEELELFLLKRKILYQLNRMEKDEDFVISIGLTGEEDTHER